MSLPSTIALFATTALVLLIVPGPTDAPGLARTACVLGTRA